MQRTIIIKNAFVMQEDKFITANLLLENGVIIDISDTVSPPESEDALIIDMSGNYALPGFIDIHTHGALGIDVARANKAELSTLSEYFAAQGVTGWLASLFADTEEGLNKSIDMLCEYAKDASSGAALLGIHLEGLFVAPAHRGVFPERLLKEGDLALFERLKNRACGMLHYITLAPEVPGVYEMIAPISRAGVVVALGHTGADYDLSISSIKSGATAITHTFNAMKPFEHHEPSIIGAALESDVYCEIICDGFHLHPATVRMMLKTKGYDRIVAVTDSNMAAGMGDGRYRLNDVDIIVENGDAKSAIDGRRAASTLTMITALKNLKSFTGQPINKLSKLLSANPAVMFGLNKSKGYIKRGFDADLVFLNQKDEVVLTVAAGRIVYNRLD